MQDRPSIVLLALQPAHQEAARELIFVYLAERWGCLDLSLNPDLADLCAAYRTGFFVTAWQENTLVGTGAFLPEANKTARIVRMTVAESRRGQGIGKAIFQHLCQKAASAGYNRIVVETTADWHDAIAFYTHCGCRSLGVRDGDHHFEKTISP